MSRLWPILVCVLLAPLLAGAALVASTLDDADSGCAHACPCEEPAEASADVAHGTRGVHPCPDADHDEACPPGCDDCPCCPGGLVAMAHAVTIPPPVHDIREVPSGPAERPARGTTEKPFIPPEASLV